MYEHELLSLYNSGADSIGHWWHAPHTPGTFTNAEHRGAPWAEEKLTKLYWPSRKCWRKRLIVCLFLEPKKWSGTTKKFRSLEPDRCPHACTFKFVSSSMVP